MHCCVHALHVQLHQTLQATRGVGRQPHTLLLGILLLLGLLLLLLPLLLSPEVPLPPRPLWMGRGREGQDVSATAQQDTTGPCRAMPCTTAHMQACAVLCLGARG